MRGAPGTPCTLTANSWECADPEPGDYLVTEAGSAYRIWRVDELPKRETKRFKLHCTRVPIAEVDRDGTVFTWTWGSRRRAAA